ncbi:toll/interleukin-1 receptor domain-containing protein [Lentzea sp. NPDC058436]|uniref:toll/interleukin-1 receptor domain-containing protein n=1 Tax=Lentzea sp. NPDC058436 TaxID=3346499 RepID=UPI00365EF549
MSWIFINYRTQDEPGFAALLQRELSRALGAAAVFHAGSCIRPGDDFTAGLLDGVRGAGVLVAVIGARWFTTPHESGGRAVDHESDWVRREIAEAFARGIRVVPVLINDVERLTNASLPADVQRLATCQYLRLRHRDVEFDLARITAELAVHVGRGAWSALPRL